MSALAEEFLSTLPARGATGRVEPVDQLVPISIHAPREGSDQGAVAHLAGGSISIHAPREGGDLTADQYQAVFGISIHAPREGSDGPQRP